MTGLLIVDDEEGIRRSLKKVFEKEEYAVFQACNGADAVRLVEVERHLIDVVISDFRMPGMDGLETLKAIEKINPEITRIILTGYATMESAIESVNARIDGFLTKPFDNWELKAKVREYHLRRRLKQFVSDQVFTAIQQDKTSLRPRSQRVAILFCDIRGFSNLTRRFSPAELAEILNAYYFSPLDNIIYEKDGTLDKHIGDSIMGIFGAPVSHENNAYRAVCAAIRMQNQIRQGNRDLAERGIALRIGIGISTGEAVVGVFGSVRKKEYTVFGAPVNLASRLERFARSGEIIICTETAAEIMQQVALEKLAPVFLKGIDREVDLFRVKADAGDGGFDSFSVPVDLPPNGYDPPVISAR